MSNDTYVWIGAAEGQLSDPANWFDTTTHAVATTAPTSGTTLVFKPGTYSATPISSDSVNAEAGRLVLLPGAHLTLNSVSASGSPVPPGGVILGKIVEQAGSSLTVSGVALTANSVRLLPGATFDGREGGISGHPPFGIFPVEIGSLLNIGGTVLLNAAVGNIAQPNLNANHPGPGFMQIGGILQTESAVPGATTLRVDLGAIKQGSTVGPLQFAADNPNQTAGYADLTIGARGHGFTTDLFPSIAAALAAQAATNDPTLANVAPIGSVNVDTSSLGTHRELISLDSGGKHVETLVITDRIV